jgi:hypothetical protein
VVQASVAPHRAPHHLPRHALAGGDGASVDPADAALDALLALVADEQRAVGAMPTDPGSETAADACVSDAEFAGLLDAFSGLATTPAGAVEHGDGGTPPPEALCDALADVQARLAAVAGEQPELKRIAAELDTLTGALRAAVDR